MEERAQIILNRINELALISGQPSCITRTYGTPAFVEGSKKVAAWFSAAGLQTYTDQIGNVRGRLLSSDAKAKTFVIASHIDTVVNAGKFDGPLGVLMGLSLVEQLIKMQVTLPFNIELIAFCDEEGVRFHTTYLGSKVVAGSFDAELLDKTDAAGIPLRTAITTIGGDPALLKKDSLARDEWLGYFEIHIEQGPVLYEANIPVALVTAIAGQKRASITFTGTAGHAGTVPMNMRNDAMCCAAECILAVEKYAGVNAAVLATVGKVYLTNAASNVIPGSVVCSLDLRSANDDDLDNAWYDLGVLMKAICQKRSIACGLNLIQEALPVKCDYHLSFLLKSAIAKMGYTIKELVSGAGHDAVPISAVAPVSMMFVRCFKGISHNPLEDVETKDIAAALLVADQFIQNLINYYNQE